MLFSALTAGCGSAPSSDVLVLATTTSVEDSGLLDRLIDSYGQQHPDLVIRPLAVGSGEALELGRRRDADLLIVHHPALEEAFVAEGHGERRVPIMYNDFVIVGPPEDPAGVRAAQTAPLALRAIAESGQLFLSRGDNSGTHGRELEIWEAAGGVPTGEPWYLEAGQGMGPLLQMASERRAYALSDRSTFLFMEPRLDLAILHEGDPALRNVYSAILVRGTHAEAPAREFLQWLTSADGQRVVDGYRDGRGRPLFHPIQPSEAAMDPRTSSNSSIAGSPAERAGRDLGDRSPPGGQPAREGRRPEPPGQAHPAGLRERFLCRSLPPSRAGSLCG